MGMISTLALIAFAGSLLAQETEWIAAGNRALDKGSAEEAAADFARALDEHLRAGVPVKDLLHLRVTLATAYMEARRYREMEAVLQEAQKTVGKLTDRLSRAELLNAWSALHLKLGRVAEAQSELQEARGIVEELPDPGDLLPTVLHNLAAVEMRTRRYEAALGHEQEAIRGLENASVPDYAMLIRAWASLGSLQYMMSQPQEARVSTERALMLAENTYGPTHPLVADLLESDAVVLEKLRLKRDARRARERALRTRGMEAAEGEDRMSWDVREGATAERLRIK
jgi:tetratricopeptide (TPR) repeat protein